MNYYINIHKSTSLATVHLASCIFCNNGNGPIDAVGDNGDWHGPFPSFQKAHEAALYAGQDGTASCDDCIHSNVNVSKQKVFVTDVYLGGHFHCNPIGRVRLARVKSPPVAFGKESAREYHLLEGLVLHKTIEVEALGTDSDGMIIAEVYVGDIHVNEAMIKVGFDLQ